MGDQKKRKRKRSKKSESRKKKKKKKKKRKSKKRRRRSSSSSPSTQYSSASSSASESESRRLAKYSQTSSSDEDADEASIRRARKIFKKFVKIDGASKQALTQLLAMVDKGRGIAIRTMDDKKVRKQLRQLFKCVKTKKRGDYIYRTHRTPMLHDLFMQVVKENTVEDTRTYILPIFPKREIHDLCSIWKSEDVRAPALVGSSLQVLDEGRPVRVPYDEAARENLKKMSRLEMFLNLLGLKVAIVEIERGVSKFRAQVFTKPETWAPDFKMKDNLIQLFIRGLARQPDRSLLDPSVEDLLGEDPIGNPRAYGPCLPSELAKGGQKKQIGPVLPPSGSVPETMGKTDKEIGPSLPPSGKVSTEDKSAEEESEKEDIGGIGPTAPTQADLELTYSSGDEEFGPGFGPMDDRRRRHMAASRICTQMKKYMDEVEFGTAEQKKNDENKPKHEAWMTTIPDASELIKAFGSGARKFGMSSKVAEEWMMTPDALKAKKHVQQAHKQIKEAAAKALAKIGYTLDDALNPIGSSNVIRPEKAKPIRMSLFEENRQKVLIMQAEWDRKRKAGQRNLGERPVVPEKPDIASLGNYRDHRLRDNDRFGDVEML